jgi:uncharacterized protein
VRVVLDSNVYISALMFPGGSAETALLAAVDGKYTVAISKAVIHEVLDVLARKFDQSSEELSRVAVFLAEVGEVVRPSKTLRILRDEPDNRILECAVAGSADLIVTGDRAMLAHGRHGGIRIVSLRQFLAEVSTSDRSA